MATADTVQSSMRKLTWKFFRCEHLRPQLDSWSPKVPQCCRHSLQPFCLRWVNCWRSPQRCVRLGHVTFSNVLLYLSTGVICKFAIIALVINRFLYDLQLACVSVKRRLSQTICLLDLICAIQLNKSNHDISHHEADTQTVVGFPRNRHSPVDLGLDLELLIRIERDVPAARCREGHMTSPCLPWQLKQI